jgi:hypothetical protein
MGGRGSGWWPERGSEGEDEGRAPTPGRGADRGDAEGAGEGEPTPAEGGRPAGKPPQRPPRGLASRDRPRRASRYSLFVGLAFAAIATLAVINAVRTEEGGIAGADPDANRGMPLPEFAVPQIPGPAPAGADANIAQDDCESSRNPCPEEEVRSPACEVEVEGAIRVCDLFDKPLAISLWFTRGGDCLPSQDAFDAVAGRRGEELNFLSVNVLDEAGDVEEIVRSRGWRVPVGHDSDGAVSNLTGVGVCPTILLAYPGGILHAAEITPGNFTAGEIDEMADDLLAATAERGGAS